MVGDLESNESLKEIWSEVLSDTKDSQEFFMHKGVLMRRSPQKELDLSDTEQVVVPSKFRDEILSLAHDSLFAGHLGTIKTYERVSTDFYWPGMYKHTEKFCNTCHVYQVAVNSPDSFEVSSRCRRGFLQGVD